MKFGEGAAGSWLVLKTALMGENKTKASFIAKSDAEIGEKLIEVGRVFRLG